MCTRKVPGRNYNPCRRRCHGVPAPVVPGLPVVPMLAVTPSVQLLPCPGHQPSEPTISINPAHRHCSGCQAHQAPLYQHLRPPPNLSVGCWSPCLTRLPANASVGVPLLRQDCFISWPIQAEWRLSQPPLGITKITVPTSRSSLGYWGC